MTSTSHFEEEKQHVANLLDHLGVEYCVLEEGADPPDVIIRKSELTIAVEVTQYHQTQDMRSRESAWEAIGKSISQRRKLDPKKLEHVHVLFSFNEKLLPSKGKRDRFVLDALELVEDEFESLGVRKVIKTFNSQLLATHLNRIKIETIEGSYRRWNSNVEGGSVGLRQAELLDALAAKTLRQPKCQLAREHVWLLIVGGHRTSQFMGLFDVEDLEEFDRLRSQLRTSHYGQVYLLPYSENRLYRWTRDDGWVQL